MIKCDAVSWKGRIVSRNPEISPLAGTARFLGGVLALTLSTIPAAQAYIDPGTGSMLLQLFGASVAAGIFYFGEIRNRLKALFSRRTATSAEPVPEPSVEPDPESPTDDRVR